MVFGGAHGVSAHQFHTKWCRLIFATSVAVPPGSAVDMNSVETTKRIVGRRWIRRRGRRARSTRSVFSEPRGESSLTLRAVF